MKKVCISFSTFTDANFLQKGEFIYFSLNDNPLYTTLETILPGVLLAIEKYRNDLGFAGTNDRNAVANKNQSREALTVLLKQLGMAVMAEAKGNEAMLISSGYTLVKPREARYITNPGNVTLSNGISAGQMVSSVKAVIGAKSYVYQILDTLPTEDSIWMSTTSSGSKFVFDNLIPGKQYWVRVAAVGSRQQVAYSPISTWFAQ